MSVFLSAERMTSTEPALLPSKAASEETLTRYLRFEQGDWDSEDTFYVVTDALAAWFLRVSCVRTPWEPLRDLDRQLSMRIFVVGLRQGVQPARCGMMIDPCPYRHPLGVTGMPAGYPTGVDYREALFRTDLCFSDPVLKAGKTVQESARFPQGYKRELRQRVHAHWF